MNILTIDNDKDNYLSTIASEIDFTDPEDLKQVRYIADQLEQTAIPLLPISGVAAPQIGFSKRMFIYSYDGTKEHLEIVINPKLTPIGDEMIQSWEACLSTKKDNDEHIAANIARYKKILVTYQDLAGNLHEQILEDYTARIFQHELDHLDGILNIYKPGSEAKAFKNTEAMVEYMRSLKKKALVDAN